jgi:hypothetical protein
VVSKQDRLDWIARGSPFRLMRPAADLRDRLRDYGYTVYDLGDTQHLEAEPPEDHTPYSATGWPGKAKYGIGYAIDIMPPARAGLPSLQKLGAQLLADRKAGDAEIRWLKYMNWEPQRNNGGACYHESWQPNYRRTSSNDRGHIHISGLTGYEDSSTGQDYDPVARVRGEDEDDMAKVNQADWEALIYRVEAMVNGRDRVASGPTKGSPVFVVQQLKQLADSMNDPNLAIALYRMEALTQGLDTVREGPTKGEPVYLVQAIKALSNALGQVDEAVAEQLQDDFQRIEDAIAAFQGPSGQS